MSDLPALLPRRHALLNWGVLLAFAAALLTLVALLATFLAAIGHGRGPAWAQGTLTVGTWLVENVRANGLPGALVFLLALLLNVLSLPCSAPSPCWRSGCPWHCCAGACIACSAGSCWATRPCARGWTPAGNCRTTSMPGATRR